MKIYFKYFVLLLGIFFIMPVIEIKANEIEIKDDQVNFFDLPALEGIMVFSVKTRDKSNHDLWIMNADGGDIRRITNTNYNEVEPTISPDGQYVAFAHDREGDWRIGIMSLDNPKPTDPWPITFYNDQRNPDWGDKDLIAFQSNQEGMWSIWSKDPFMKGDLYGQDLKEESNISKWGDVEMENDVKHPSYSEDGRYLAFATNRDGQNADNRINRIWVLDRQTRESKAIPRSMVKQGDDPEFYKGRNWYPDANGLPVIAYVQIKDGSPTIRWTNIDGSGGGKLTDRMPGNIVAKNPRFGPEGSQEVLAFLTEKNPGSGWKIAVMDIHRGQNMPPVIVTPPSMGASIDSFDWGIHPHSGGGMMDRMRNMMPGGNNRGGGNQMDDRMMEEGRKMMQEQEGMQRRMMDEQRNMEEERMRMEREREEEDRRRQDQERDRRQQEDQERFKMEQERRALELKSEQDRLSMEDERRMRELEQRREEMEMEGDMREEQMRMDEERREMERRDEEERMAQQARMMEEQRRMMREEAAARGGTGPGPDGGGPGGEFYVRGASEEQYNCMVQTLGPPVVEQFNFRDPRPEEYERLNNNGCEGIPELFGQEVYGDDDRGFFGKPKMGALKTGGPGEMMQDPTMLAVAGLVVTVGATLLQMARGK
jgi:hypothetical protein